MYKKLIKNDIKKSKLISAAITVFILIAALLTSLASILTVNLVTAIDSMMIKAKTPHYLQMHTGEIDRSRLSAFAESQNVIEDFQILSFINIEGSEIAIGNGSLADSVQDNGFSMQSEKFDFLLDLDGNIIHPADGELYVPIHYMKEGKANVGDTVSIHGVPFTVAGLMRDSQMNAAMISSKRFLISENDFNKLQEYGNMEYLIEFRLTDTADVSALEAAYLEAGLEASGPPAITHTMFKLANAISDGIMIAILILISALVIAINFLCIRFTLIAKIEEDYREIGVLKALGLKVSSIKKLYLAKYAVLAGVGSVVGFLLSLFVKEPFMENIRLYMGAGQNPWLGNLLGALGAGFIFVVILLYVNGVLSRFKKLSAAQAVRFGAPTEKPTAAKGFKLSNKRILSVNVFLGVKDVLARKKLYITMLLVLVLSSFLMIVPQNLYNTMSQRNFMTYMGIGECDLRFDIQQTSDISGKTIEIANALAQDGDIEHFTILNSYMFDMQMDSGSTGKLKVELGDHSVFPISYSQGNAPQNENKIAISALVSDDIGKGIGDTMAITVDGEEKQLTICGIYSDITNGGRTSKAVFNPGDSQIIWSVIPVTLQDAAPVKEKVAEYKEVFSFAKIADVDEYLDQSFGTTIDAAKKASYASVLAAALLSALVTLLFMKMLVTKDRSATALLKSLGFKNQNIKIQYYVSSAVIVVIGVLIGTVLANTLGEQVGVGLISQFGASSFHFEVNPLFAYLFSPVLIAFCVMIATKFGTADITSLKISEHIKE